MTEQQNPGQVQFRITDETSKGVYANDSYISLNKEEAQILFANRDLALGVNVIVSKVLISPGHLKRLAKVMTDLAEKYEKEIGKLDGEQSPKNQIGFKAE